MEIEANTSTEDDGRIRRGNVGTATAHAFTAAVGAGILALPWSMAQLGWILGLIVLFAFAFITYYTAILLADCYRTPDPVHGKRNYTYIAAVRSLLGPTNELVCGVMGYCENAGPTNELVCGVLQYTLLWGTLIGYTVTTAVSTAAVRRTTCYHAKGKQAECQVSGNLYMIIFGAIQILLSQCPNLEKVAFLSVFASATSFAYSLIALGLSIAKLASNHHFKGTTKVAFSPFPEATSVKFGHVFQALGNIALAYTFSIVLLEIQDTLKSHPPENKVMKRATAFAIGGTTLFYVTLGVMGYTAFGDKVAGNVLAGFEQPYWLVVIANLCVILHLIGAYQVFGQPIFAINEKLLASKFPASLFTTVHTMKIPFTEKSVFSFSLSRILLRSAFVIVSTLIAMMFPFFNGILGLLGAIAFWPLTVQFPLRMYTEQAKVQKWSYRWTCFQVLSLVCLTVTLVSGIGSVASMLDSFKKAKLFHINL